MKRRGLARVAGAAFLTTFAVAVWATPAVAHDVLVRTVPAGGLTVATVPSRVTLVFEEPALALGTAMEVQGPRGQEATGHPILVNSTVSTDIRPDAPPGRYLVRWRVTSDDGHPVSGSFTFTAEAAGGGTAIAAPPASPKPSGSSGLVLLGWVAVIAVVVAGLVAVLTGRRIGRRRATEGGGQ